jgi:hypothetical protein
MASNTPQGSNLTINFDLHPSGLPSLNVSIQVTDVVYTSILASEFDDLAQGGVNQPWDSTVSTKPFPIGIVTAVDYAHNAITIDTSGYLPTPILTNEHYLFFSKDPVVNTSGIIGYFAEAEYRNYSNSKAEIFATAVDYAESSK